MNSTESVNKAISHVKINRNAIVPHYQQIQENLLEAIESGELAEGDLLPSEREFAEALGISRMTIRRAFKELEARGWLEGRVGRGWYVRPSKIEQRLSKLSGFSSDMESLRLRVTSKVLDFREQSASAALGERMEIPIGSPTFYLERIRFVSSEPLGIEMSNLRADFCPTLMDYDFNKDSLYRVLREEFDLELGSADQTVEASLADWREATLLEIEEGTPVLRGSRITRASGGQVIEASSAVYRGDRYKYRVRIAEKIKAEAIVH
ncbi:MAG: GntR family transcriptional regulator [Anaerolineales bacterium]